MPIVETYTGYDKFTGDSIFVKKFKDFKLYKNDMQGVIMNMIDRTLTLQEESKNCIIRIVKYNFADNNLYIFTQQCETSMRSLLIKQRAFNQFSLED